MHLLWILKHGMVAFLAKGPQEISSNYGLLHTLHPERFSGVSCYETINYTPFISTTYQYSLVFYFILLLCVLFHVCLEEVCHTFERAIYLSREIFLPETS